MAAQRKLSFGLWYDFRNPPAWRRTDKEIYDATVDQITWAETIGYDDVWLTEHHFVDDGHAPTPLILAAAIRAYTTAVPVERFYCWTVPPGFPVRKMDEHLELMATKVMPHFR